MTTHFKKNFWRLSKWSGGLFVLLFVFRIIYGYVATDPLPSGDSGDSFFNNVGSLRKNYASEKNAIHSDVQVAHHEASSQKYEKTASIKAKTTAFENDEKQLKAKTEACNAVIQYEQNLGQKGNRQIHLVIGVNPLLFDSLYLELQKIGEIKATEITKVDKTNEYRELNAKKASIEKSLLSLNELKAKSGQISEYVALNDKILEIEEKAQDLGVELGNFDSENEFCTVKLSMYEGAAEQGISFMHRIKVALEWTIKYFAMLVTMVLVLSLAIFILLLIIDKLKVMNFINNKINE